MHELTANEIALLIDLIDMQPADKVTPAQTLLRQKLADMHYLLVMGDS